MIGRFRMTEEVAEADQRGFDDFDLRLGDVMRGERATLGKSLLDVQRELKIKATYIAAIENADPSAFETPGFIAGYVRSYARYLGLDPEWAYKAFCAEGNFETAHGMSHAASAKRQTTEPRQQTGEKRDPLADSRFTQRPKGDGFLARIEPGAIGSVAVLVALIGVIGYGGVSVLKEIQKVQFVPVDQAPVLASELDPLAGATTQPEVGEDVAGLPAQTAEAFDRIYRPEALEVPVLTARDGPIAALDPLQTGSLAPGGDGFRAPQPGDAALRERAAMAALEGPAAGDPGTVLLEQARLDGGDMQALTSGSATDLAVAEALGQGGDLAGPKVLADGVPQVMVLAVRPSWVRIKSAEGTVLLEKILQPGDNFVLPKTEAPATLRTGESGAIYFAVNGQTYGPAGGAGQVTGNLSLAAADLTQVYDVADPTSDGDLRVLLAELDLTPAFPGAAQDAASTGGR
ncbi:helix-turn-helix domain-containing protein [Mesobaculum littorinae]|uniref:Helix-turn-helix domain-containing protein n=1 Tax=Mesobaculum littorinae TaxID=2486419 RepID=A0A438AM10_9RHOB|nr:helix-turn-helix domain-containing protein [Mesobaculum littorinae]RVV99788.1 helix-turn-helix domain-containing protein [Mesobaculum littorinae]